MGKRNSQFAPRKPKPPPYEVIRCSTEETTLTNDNGIEIKGVVTTCSKCGHEVESYCTAARSKHRNFYLMAEECPLKGEDGLIDGKRNYYVGGGHDDDTKPR